jgi:hypothetical protein
MSAIRMQFYCQRNPDGAIHVQNAVMGHLGQHHVHTQKDWDRWSKTVPAEDISWYPEGKYDPCDCGLKPGEKKSGLQ